MNNENKIKRTLNCFSNFCKNKIPPLIYTGVLLFYFFFFTMSYFVPLLFTSTFSQYNTYNNYFSEFKEFHNNNYKLQKGERIIWIEFYSFLFLYSMLILSFILSAFTEPGKIPGHSIWKIQIDDNLEEDSQFEQFAYQLAKREELLLSNRNTIMENNLNDSRSTASTSSTTELNVYYIVNERTEENSVRYCLKCKIFKPDRTHHCKLCDRCVLKIDHHCPWVGNCIGHRNYKYFNSMILYGLLTSAYFNYILFDVVRFLLKEGKLESSKLIILCVIYIFMMMLMIVLLIFNIFHIWITIFNFTTHEYISKLIRKKGVRKSSPDVIDNSSIYDISPFENWKQVYGWNPLLWFLPINCTYNAMWNNGINFKLNRRHEFEVIKSV